MCYPVIIFFDLLIKNIRMLKAPNNHHPPGDEAIQQMARRERNTHRSTGAHSNSARNHGRRLPRHGNGEKNREREELEQAS